jgi:hypothetical protein
VSDKPLILFGINPTTTLFYVRRLKPAATFLVYPEIIRGASLALTFSRCLYVIPVIQVLHILEGLGEVIAQVGLGGQGINDLKTKIESADDNDPENDFYDG